MKNILAVSAVAWLLTIALALMSSPPKSAQNESFECAIRDGDKPQSKKATKTAGCEAYVGSETTEDKLELANAGSKR